jgi:hypothetical protein
LFSQSIDCEKTVTFLKEKEIQIAHLNLHDPDYIPLHFLIAKDITKELVQFRKEVIPYFTECEEITFSGLINKYDELINNLQIKQDSLSWLNANIHLIFYEQALFEYQFNNEADADYYLQRSLQYNDTFPDAILLKLNKLLDKNHFEACLSLLNSLYYETQMNRAQEMHAIEFTAQFYSKLYNTADSLVKMEHAAEALALFEVLERFCLNLPTSYCNDDYFHGVLRSKSGIYESYLAIAKVAEKRGNTAIATHFYQYAQEYLESNPYLQNAEREKEEREKEERKKEERKTEEREKEERKKEERKKEEMEKEKPLVAEGTNPRMQESTKEEKEKGEPLGMPKPLVAESNTQSTTPLLTETPATIKEKYDNLVIQALALCINEEFSESYKMFLAAKKMEECNCFKTDFRVELMLRELSKYLK